MMTLMVVAMIVVMEAKLRMVKEMEEAAMQTEKNKIGENDGCYDCGMLWGSRC